MIVLVDTNVILDIATNDPRWKPWSLAQLNGLTINNRLAINDVIFAELAPGFERFEEVNHLIDEMGLSTDAREKLARLAPGTRRDLIAKVENLELRWGGVGRLEVEFSLPSGSYATEVIRQFTRSPFLIDEADRGSDS